MMNWSDQGIRDEADAEQPCAAVHCFRVEQRRRVESAGWSELHKLPNRHCVRLNQSRQKFFGRAEGLFKLVRIYQVGKLLYGAVV